MNDEIAALVAELSLAHPQARSELDPATVRSAPPTIFEWAVDELKTRGAPALDWPVWGGLLTLLLALIALPKRRDHQALIIQLAEYCAKDPSAAAQIGIMLIDHASPDDGWMVELVARSMSKGQARLTDPAAAIAALGFVGGAAVAEMLLPLAAKTSNPLAPIAALSLARCGIGEAEGPILAQLAKKPTWELVEAAGLLRCQAALPAILELATPDSIRRRRYSDAPWVPVISKALARISPDAAAEALGRLLRELDENYDDNIVIATELARVGDPDSAAYLNDKMKGWTGRVIWGTEPMEAKWEAANLLAQRGEELGTSLIQSWYSQDPTGSRCPRGSADRYRVLQAMGQAGDASHLDFLSWVQRSDREASEKGWALAVEARRAEGRIVWRDQQISKV